MKALQLKKHLDFLVTEIGDWDDYASLAWKDYSLDRKKRRELERWIENIINSSVDIAKLALSIKDIPLPESYTRVVAALDLIAQFEPLGARLSKWVKLRNVITHEYLDIRWDSIKSFIKETKPLYAELVEKTRRFLKDIADETA